jgi:hypothetical protein
MTLRYILSCLLFISVTCSANDSVTLSSETGDKLMFHQLNDGELWGSFIVTDRIVDSFAEHEMIVMQVDQLKPISLQGKRSCGGAAGKPQTVEYHYETADQNWLFNSSSRQQTSSDIFAAIGLEDQKAYRHLTVDRRYELVDFPIQATVGLPELFQQFQSAKSVVFRYTTQAFEQRLAEFHINEGQNAQLDRLLNRKKAP